MTEPQSLRRAVLADVPAIRLLSRAAYAKWFPLIGREPLPMTADYARSVTEHIIDLVEESGQLLALIEMVPKSDHLLIENIAVRPDQQGKGLAIALSSCRRNRAKLGLHRSPALHQCCLRRELGLLRETGISGVPQRYDGFR